MKLNVWVSSAQAKELLSKQLVTWPIAQENYRALATKVRIKTFEMGGFTAKVQYNPARSVSSFAKLDKMSLQARKCFLCKENLPEEQIGLSFGYDYLVLCNPYPIFPEHFTVTARQHTDQVILPRLHDFLELARRLESFTVFYNGPRSGASAPDHAHFQAVTRSVMPIDDEWAMLLEKHGRLLWERPAGQLYGFGHYLRNGFIVRANTEEAATACFRAVYDALEKDEDEVEPKMNLFAQYINKSWMLVVIPRRQHRPSQFFAEGAEQVLCSPGAADVGGLFITSREEDFEKMTPALLRSIYEQVCFTDAETRKIAQTIVERCK